MSTDLKFSLVTTIIVPRFDRGRGFDCRAALISSRGEPRSPSHLPSCLLAKWQSVFSFCYFHFL